MSSLKKGSDLSGDGVNKEDCDLSSGDMEPHVAEPNVKCLTKKEQVKAKIIQELKNQFGRKIIDEMNDSSRQVTEAAQILHRQCNRELGKAHREIVKIKEFTAVRINDLNRRVAKIKNAKPASLPDQSSSSSSQDSMNG